MLAAGDPVRGKERSVKRTPAILSPLLLLIALVAPCPVLAQELNEEELERWFEDDEQLEPYVKRGGGEQLEFLAPDTSQRIPFSQTRLHLTPRSVQTGWVGVVQCHDGLDPVPDAEVVYRFRRMRNLRVTEASGIGRAWVVGQSVQLKDVGKAARLCVELEAQVLYRQTNALYLLRYGPFQRKFLDSYFPMHIVLEVEYGETSLKLEEITPAPTQGFARRQGRNRLALEGWFRGKLTVELLFRKEGDKANPSEN